jgi:hypothetical protein
MIGKTIDISVTSVLQTTAGKMIFGKFDERMAGRPEAPRTEQRSVEPPRPQPPKTQTVVLERPIE